MKGPSDADPSGHINHSLAAPAGTGDLDQTRQIEGPQTAAMPRRADPSRTVFKHLRRSFGAFLFVAWAVLTIVWLASTAYSVAHANPMAAATAAGALALLTLLGLMEGLEVAVIDAWQDLWPGQPTSNLARWLAARQLFVASIVTAATLLGNRDVLVVPFTTLKTTDGFVLGLFDLAWTTFTVLWFAQIMPKHLGAMNPRRYVHHLRPTLFPIVDFVRKIGVSLPGEWTAYVLEYGLAWPARTKEEADAMRHKHSMGGIWRELRLDIEAEEQEKKDEAGQPPRPPAR